MSQRKTLLILSQVYVPDPAAVGQHMHDAAAEMAKRGWRVVVYASARGYDDPTQRYPAREVRDGVEIRRLPFSSFGKGSIALRLLGGWVFLAQALLRGLWVRGLRAVLVSTSPPMASMAAVVIRWLRRVPMKYWVMDLNPDQMIELGRLRADAWSARFFDAMNRLALKQAADVIVLDRFMAQRVCRKRDVRDKLTVLPPWPHEDHLELIAHEANPFRHQYNPQGRFVIMYSGNHGFSTPVTTVLEAALRLQDEERLLFMFIGGGVGKKEVDETIARHKPTNIISLPYQPLERIKYSLSAADVHLVSVGDPVVGVVHPCKVYGAMALRRPILLLGPDPCHVSDLIRDHGIGWRIAHGDVDGAVATIRQILAAPPQELRAMGDRAGRLVQSRFSKGMLIQEFCDVLERGRPSARRTGLAASSPST
jgi:glycosyltransferase involved in cell wall biosynthesis